MASEDRYLVAVAFTLLLIPFLSSALRVLLSRPGLGLIRLQMSMSSEATGQINTPTPNYHIWQTIQAVQGPLFTEVTDEQCCPEAAPVGGW